MGGEWELNCIYWDRYIVDRVFVNDVILMQEQQGNQICDVKGGFSKIYLS